jgi:hypothetical protein
MTELETPLRRQIKTDLADLVEEVERFRSFATGTAWWTGETGRAAVDALELVGPLRAQLDEVVALVVRQARAEGASWSEIADPLAMTKQGAQQRWGTATDHR